LEHVVAMTANDLAGELLVRLSPASAGRSLL
jgi:hypothetical protein